MKSNAGRGCFILIVLLVIIIGLTIFTSTILPKFGLAVRAPSVSLAPEVLIHDVVPGLNITNGTISMVIVLVITMTILISTNLSFKKQRVETYVPTNGISTMLYMVVEFWDGQVEGFEKHKYRIMPLALTIFLFFSVANLVKMIPGTETVGMKECAQVGQTGYPVHFGFLDTKGAAIVTEEQYQKCEETGEGLFMVVPYVKPLATDINAPIVVAVIVFIAVQVFGVIALGPGYFYKFINLPAVGSGKIMDVIVGGIETISEFMRPLSLALRITFVMFAGGILILVFGYLLGPTGAFLFYALELVIGLFQAFIFTILTLVYGAGAVQHHEE